MCKFSIMIPLYNKKPYLKLYFDRIINQTFDDYEIVVVDDYSNDGSYEYMKELSEVNQKIKLYRNKENLGLGLTRNNLLENASGEYLLFIDPDDYIEYDLLEVVNEYLIDDIEIIRYQNVSIPMTERQKELESTEDKYRFCCEPTEIITGEEALLKWFMGERNINTMPWTYCIKKDLYDDISYPNTSVLEDFGVTPYIIAKAKKIKAIDYCGYYYLQYDDSLTKCNLSKEERIKFAHNKLKIFREVIKLLEQNMNKTNISEETKKIFFEDVNNRYQIRKKRYENLKTGE